MSVQQWMSLWKRSCGSTWTSSPSILTDYFVPRVTTWSFRLKVCSAPVFPSIDFSMAAPTECAVSTLTVGWACSPVAMFRMLKSLLKGFRSCRCRRTASVSFYSRACLAWLISLSCYPVLFVVNPCEFLRGLIYFSTGWHWQQPQQAMLLRYPSPSC